MMKKKMTVRESLDYVKRGHGKPLTKEGYEKFVTFLKSLPQNPKEHQFRGAMLPSYREEDAPTDWIDAMSYNGKFALETRTIKDYEEGWQAVVAYRHLKDGTLHVEVSEPEPMEPNQFRTTSNAEALALVKEFNGLRNAEALDPGWEMSDDHSVHRRGHAHNDSVWSATIRIASKLR